MRGHHLFGSYRRSRTSRIRGGGPREAGVGGWSLRVSRQRRRQVACVPLRAAKRVMNLLATLESGSRWPVHVIGPLTSPCRERQPAHRAIDEGGVSTTYIEGVSKVSNLRIHLALISAIFLLGRALPTQADAVTEWNAVTANCSVNRIGPSGLFDIALVQTAVHDASRRSRAGLRHTSTRTRRCWALVHRKRRPRRHPMARWWASMEPATRVLRP